MVRTSVEPKITYYCAATRYGGRIGPRSGERGSDEVEYDQERLFGEGTFLIEDSLSLPFSPSEQRQAEDAFCTLILL